ncbi:MAG TPA: hypothetical protein VNM67_23975 [Thermoanaerobaculia bacterium]|nr:hypothetical protein [Thermoanaerobaculia bacterium]
MQVTISRHDLAYAVHAVEPKNAFLAALAVPFTYSYPLAMGFYNFCFGLTALFFALGLLAGALGILGSPAGVWADPCLAGPGAVRGLKAGVSAPPGRLSRRR